jgi:thiosulfate reductase cytochrome b subunit
MMKIPAGVLLVCLLASATVAANDFHPEFELLDSGGEAVSVSGNTLSLMTTCGACHDTAFIRDSSDHVAAGVFGQQEMDCLACHADPGAEPGAVGRLNIHKPGDENCAQCHGIVGNDLDIPLTVPSGPDGRSMTDRTGEIISPQKVSNSGLNIAGKELLTHPFDVHADRVVGCVNCHYSLNNPVYFQQRRESRPVHLVFDPRRLTSADYLARPLHQLAKGGSSQGQGTAQSENSMRRCEGCHTAENVHEWLPYKSRHFDSLACEACHIPRLYGPALQAIDWTLVDPDGRPQRQYRDVEGDPASADSLIDGFRPVMLPRENVGGERKLAPFNLVSSWHWTAGEPATQVTADQLLAALYVNGRLHPDLHDLFDSNSDGQVWGPELTLGTPAQAEAVRSRLLDSGLSNVQLASTVTPYPVSHNVVNGQWATRECRNCHGADSVFAAAFTLSDHLPGGLLPAIEDASPVTLSGGIDELGGGAKFTPDLRTEGYYIIGLDAVDLVDQAGLLMFLGISLGVTVHATGRYVANRRRPRRRHARKRVYMYDAYERLWHWLQAGAILMLIFTGLIIHKPHFFGIFSFSYIVQVHNVLGFILLINAALALFYTVASGTIKRFLPAPKGFFGRAIAQTMYYSRGIFAGEPHPLEKTREHRLNPLQQITYLAILNVFLPAQVITGVLIWGMQEWPHLAASLGGLPVLAPVHTFLAWAFSAFIVMHVYLTTAAGDTAGAGIKSMISGWEDVEQNHGESAND